MIQLAIETGLRVSELTALTRADTHLDSAAHVACHGKGRKDRITPLTKPTAARPAQLASRARRADRADPLFPTSRGQPLTRDAVARRLTIYTHHRRGELPDPARQERHPARPAPHRRDAPTARRRRHRRHRALARTRIVETTRIYLDADLSIKERALARTRPTTINPGRYKPTDSALAFLDAL